MGIVEKWFGKKRAQPEERMWLTKEGKIDDLLAHLRSEAGRGVRSVVVTHFEDTQLSLIEVLGKGGFHCHVINSPSQFASGIPDGFNRERQILVLASESISSLAVRGTRPQPGGAPLVPVSVHLFERYPLPERDQRVLDLGNVWPVRPEFTCYTSLDEPWLSSFGLDRIRRVLPQLGMDEGTVLVHPMLARSVRSAQKKLARQVPHEQKGASGEEWVRRNLNRGS